jgi:hypothetical protein
MTILNSNSSAAARHPVVTTLFFATIGFVCGFLLSLVLSAYSLYACIEVL